MDGIKIDYTKHSEKEKDQFFTSKESSQYCIDKTYEILKKWNVDISNYHFIEPSAGDGSFYNLLPPDKRTGIDIEPKSDEIEESKKIESISIMNNDEPLNIIELAGLISKASYVVANDTGPAHMTAHLGKSGVALFGHHTTAKKVSIETEKFKAITVYNLNDLTAEKVYLKIRDKLKLIN